MEASFFLVADIVVIRKIDKKPEVLLIKRAGNPYQDFWALPGGFVEEDEKIADAARRELEEETGIRATNMDYLGFFDEPDRDPRGRTVSAAFLCICDEDTEAKAQDDAIDFRWCELNKLPKLAFDHKEIIKAAKEAL